MLYIFDMGGVVTTTAAVERRICGILGISEDDFMRICGDFCCVAPSFAAVPLPF